MNRLLIVSNRLPVTIKVERGEISVARSAGGLATGMRGPHERMQSSWLGWPGDVSRLNQSQRAKLEKSLSELRAIPIYLSQTEINRYYEGFSNGVIWPLFHYLTDKVQRDAWKNWKTYEQVNKRFAESVAAHYRPGDMIWVHDYQLSLMPGLVRRMVPSARIGFFLHIPFPSSEVFRILPWREEILEGIIGADLVGFHTYSYLRHFSRALLHVLRADVVGERFKHGDREGRLGVFPMGIDADAFSRRAQEQQVLAKVEAIKRECGERKLILGVDRLDYTKGLPRRMLAVDRLLEREPSLRDKVRMIQVVVPSRTKVESYQLYRRQLDEMIGRINGAQATVNSVPIHYLYRSVSEQQLVALYRAADIMLVTPLRDGMNLVAKEFVASRTDEDGVLILSEFAGAAAELAEAMHVNPYDIDRVALTIKKALAMPEQERQARMRALRRRVQDFDSYHWANNFVQVLQSAHKDEAVYPQSISSSEEIDCLAQKLRKVKKLTLILDYDGTIVPIASTPQLAAPDAELKRLLKSLAERSGTQVHVLSGRPHETLEQWLGDLPIGLHAEHGFWSRSSSGAQWEPLREESMDWKKKVRPILEHFTAGTPGSLIEEKTTGIAWHYRMADPDFGAIHAEELRLRLESEIRDLPIEVLLGSKVIEIRLKGVHKGVVVSHLVSNLGSSTTFLAMGDDRTDEDLFAALPPGSLSVHIGPSPSLAQYRLQDTQAARAFLKELINCGPKTSR